jgi:hypothetical protein
MVELSICSQGMGEDNPGDSTEEVMPLSSSTVSSSEELGVNPSFRGGTSSSCETKPPGAGSIKTSGTSSNSMTGFDEVGGEVS